MLASLEGLVIYSPWLAAMAGLLVLSALFSAGETAFFFLARDQVRAFRHGNRRERLVADLLAQPDRLLTAILFWNLVINLFFFAISSVVAVDIEATAGPAAGGLFGFSSLLTLIFFGEVMPKSVALIVRAGVARLLGVPLALGVRLFDPLAPTFRVVTLLFRRLFWPHLKVEPYLAAEDLERAVDFSTQDSVLLDTERMVLDNILDLSEIRVDEIMRPRGSFRLFRPPVSRQDLGLEVTPSGYLFVTEPAGEEIAGALSLTTLAEVPKEHLEHHAESPVFVPWCATAAQLLQEMRERVTSVAVVVSEYGGTIGVVTYQDLVDMILGSQASRTQRMLKRRPIRSVGPGRYLVEGITTLRRLAEHFGVEYRPGRSITLAGYIQEQLQRVPVPGDVARWEGHEVTVVQVGRRGRLLLELLAPRPEAANPPTAGKGTQ